MTLWLEFAVCTLVILFAGRALSKYGDIIAEKTGMGRTWIGFILMASVTSLPELVTGISSVAVFNLPDIAAGDVLGSCMFNILVLALVDPLSPDSPLSARAHQGQTLTAGFGIFLLALVGISIEAGARIPSLGWIGSYSVIFLATYLIAARTIYSYERRRIAEFIEEQAESAGYQEVSRKRAYIMYAVNAVLVMAAATYLPRLGDQIAQMTGLGGSFVGSIFIALSTSLPELVVSVSALRLGAVDMVYGNILGSNLFNVGILALDDILYTKGPLLSSVSANHSLTAGAAIAMTAIAVIGLIYRTGKKRLFIAWDALAIVMIHLLTTFLLYASR
jgi:cation:H+ antiporter